MKIKMKLVLMVLIPTLISGTVIGIIGQHLSRTFLNNEQATILKVALKGYSGDVNAFQEHDVDITVFEGDTRIKSSINSVEGTKASDIVIEKVLTHREEYFDTNVDVNGIAYYGYYIPTEEGMLFAGKKQTVVANNLNTMSNYIILITIISLFLFGGIGFFIAGSMAKQIQKIAVSIRSIADGDLSVKNHMKESKSRDEIADIGNATKQMADKLGMVIETTSNISTDVNTSAEELNTTSETVLSAINEVSKEVEEISSGLQNQSEAVQNISDNVISINKNIDNIKVSANDISDCSQRLDENSSLMKEKMVNMSDSNVKVNNSIEEISNKIKAISEVIESVKGIVSVIGDISSQTKLLSLNASIEAARAGEAGKGFAVVASSISDLSEDTSYQVQEITGIIKTLVEDFDECIEIINSTVEDGNEQKKDIKSVIDEFEKLSEEIEVTSDKVYRIGDSIDRSIQDMSSISQEIEELSSISENSVSNIREVNASVEEINSLMDGVTIMAETLNHKAEELHEQLKFFTMKV